MSAGISHISYFLPSAELSHNDLCERFGKEEMDRTLLNTGILSRRVSKGDQFASDLAYEAANRMIDDNHISRSEIDYLIFASQMPDYALPTTACMLQERLGLNETVGAFDINLGCSQFVYAHSVAYSLVTAKIARKVLVLTGDTPSRIINPNDKSVVPLFGDGATASIVEEVGYGFGYHGFSQGTIGAQSDALIWRGSGLRDLVKNTSTLDMSHPREFMTMDGQKIFLFTLKTVPKKVIEFLHMHKFSDDEIDFFIFHQASKMIMDSISRKLKIGEDRLIRSYESYGNCGGSSVGIALCDALLEGRIGPKSRLLFSAFGVGLSWANALYYIQPEGIKFNNYR